MKLTVAALFVAGSPKNIVPGPLTWLQVNPSTAFVSSGSVAVASRITFRFVLPVEKIVFTFGLMIGVSVNDTTLGTLVANLGYDKLVFPKPVFIGDTLRSESECIDLRESKSRPNAGIVTWAHRSFNQRGELVCECTRSALLLKKPR